MERMQLQSPVPNKFQVFLSINTSCKLFQHFLYSAFCKDYGLEFKINLDLCAFVFEAGIVKMVTAFQNTNFACRVTTI